MSGGNPPSRTQSPAAKCGDGIALELIAAASDSHVLGVTGGQQRAVLDTLDGLEADADVAFILTTNRMEVLEPALAERPGRVDRAVEIPLPDADSRRRLSARYADDLPLSPAAVTPAADRAEGVTGSFAKELMRRTVLLAAQESRAPTDADLETALEGPLSGRERLTRSLLGSPEAQPNADPVEFGPATPPAGSGYVSLQHGHFHP